MCCCCCCYYCSLAAGTFAWLASRWGEYYCCPFGLEARLSGGKGPLPSRSSWTTADSWRCWWPAGRPSAVGAAAGATVASVAGPPPPQLQPPPPPSFRSLASFRRRHCPLLGPLPPATLAAGTGATSLSWLAACGPHFGGWRPTGAAGTVAVGP